MNQRRLALLYVAVGLEKTVRNMLTSLKAVSELQNPAIRDRHWQQLMNATGVSERVANSASLLHVVHGVS